ncbi:MAG: NTP transferase domain-containing protein [Deltaproteobacteria bacterium]|nr:NTP transferase domain-containing protein [Deltaproteobacteria bacterium]
MTVALAILAAGASTRMAPRRKQLVEIDGEPLVRRAARIAIASRASHVAVVLGAFADEIAPALAGLRVTRLDNAAWTEGMASSVRTAATWAATTDATALLLCVCDQPAMTTAHLDALIAAHAADHAYADSASPARTIGSAYAGTVGVPALIPRARWPELLALRGDRGARALLGDDALPLAGGELDVDA